VTDGVGHFLEQRRIVELFIFADNTDNAAHNPSLAFT
jgi:hypothetical protein